MSNIEGFVIAVPSVNDQKFLAQADLGGSGGAPPDEPCWEEDASCGSATDS